MKMRTIAMITHLLVATAVLLLAVSLCLAESQTSATAQPPEDPTASSGSTAPVKRRGITADQRKAAAERAKARRAAAIGKTNQTDAQLPVTTVSPGQ